MKMTACWDIAPSNFVEANRPEGCHLAVEEHYQKDCEDNNK
jgi:hypothetical protein